MRCDPVPADQQTSLKQTCKERMYHLFNSHWVLLVFAAQWSFSYPSLLSTWSGIGRSKDPNVKDWGDYSDLPPGVEQGLGLEEDREHGDNRGAGDPSSSLAPELEFLADFAGKTSERMN